MENRDLIVYCDRASNSARTLAHVLGCRRWFENSTPGKKTSPVVPIVINWGASDAPNWVRPEHWPWPNAVKFHLLNGVDRVAKAINKLHTLEALKRAQVPCLEYVTEIGQTTESWLAEDGKYIARRSLTGSGGAGLRLVHPGPDGQTEPVAAPLYTRYYPKTHEFRVHVWKGQVIDFTQKKLRPELVGQAERLVRSHANGWVHAHELDPFVESSKQQIEQGAIAGLAALGLDFGAADILARYRTRRNRPLRDYRICEVNTGPGLENSTTIKAYTDAIDEHYQGIKHRRVIRPNDGSAVNG
jgi:hypothetical protein